MSKRCLQVVPCIVHSLALGPAMMTALNRKDDLACILGISVGTEKLWWRSQRKTHTRKKQINNFFHSAHCTSPGVPPLWLMADVL